MLKNCECGVPRIKIALLRVDVKKYSDYNCFSSVDVYEYEMAIIITELDLNF